MLAKLVRIGNSRGVRIPKAFIEQAGLSDEIEMTVRRGAVVLQSRRTRRAGWRKSIKAALEKHGQDVDEDFLGLPNDFDEKEWTWPQSDTMSTSSRSTPRRARK
jgi:antitoxin MazE